MNDNEGPGIFVSDTPSKDRLADHVREWTYDRLVWKIVYVGSNQIGRCFCGAERMFGDPAIAAAMSHTLTERPTKDQGP